MLIDVIHDMYLQKWNKLKSLIKHMIEEMIHRLPHLYLRAYIHCIPFHSRLQYRK